MKRSVLYIISGIAALVLCVTICSAGFAPEFEVMPLSVKAPSDASPYNDEGFLADAGSVIKKISNTTVPTGAKLSDLTDAYYRLISENVSPDFLPTANNIVAYLYYSSEAGSTYEDYHQYINSVSKTTDGSEYYNVADEYRKVAAEYWSNIKDLFPDQTMYTMPSSSDPMPTESESSEATTLEGLEISIPIEQSTPNSENPDQTDEFKTTTIRWFEDYVLNAEEAEVNPVSKEVITSKGQKFMTGEGLEWADSTYMDLIGKNIAEDFYEKAQYIDAFFYLITQARDAYEDYTNDRTYVSSVSNGQENYDKSKKYYAEAGKAITHFDDILTDSTNNTLPEFPEFGEVKLAGSAWDEQGAIGYVTTSMAEQLGWTEPDTSS